MIGRGSNGHCNDDWILDWLLLGGCLCRARRLVSAAVVSMDESRLAEWCHPGIWIEPTDHQAIPVPGTYYIQGGTGNLEAKCEGCGFALVKVGTRHDT